MLKNQEKALQWVIKNIKKTDPAHDVLCNLIYTKDYIYVTDRYCAFRLPNDTGELSDPVLLDRYPLKSLESMFKRIEERDSFLIDFTPSEALEIEKDKYFRIGADCYQQKYYKKVLAILGNDVSAYQETERYYPLHLVSKLGEGVLMPCRVW